jgi:hypothetical protein
MGQFRGVDVKRCSARLGELKARNEVLSSGISLFYVLTGVLKTSAFLMEEGWELSDPVANLEF